MRDLATNAHIVRLALPIMFAMLIPQISYVANAIFLGQYGELELRVVGVAGVFYLALGMVGYGLSNGTQIQLARRAGEGDASGVSRTFANGLFLALGIGLGMILLSLWLAPLIFRYSLYDQDNVRQSVNFIHLRGWGLPFLMLAQMINCFFIAIQRSRFLIYGAMAGTLTNILFDYLLIFGVGGFPEMGLEGAALASMMGELMNCSIMFAVFFFNKFHRTYPLFKHLKFDWNLSKKSLSISSPLIVQFLFSIGGWQLFFIFVEHLGNKELAASQIIRSMFGLVWVGIWAFAATSNTMVSNIIGQGKPKQVQLLTWKIARLSLIYALVICSIIFIFSDQVILIFRDDPVLVEFAKPAMYVVLISTLVMSVSTVLFNAVVGTGNTGVNLTIEIICVLLYVFYCYVVIERMRLSLAWAWGSEFVYWSSLLAIGFFYLRSGRWKGKRI